MKRIGFLDGLRGVAIIIAILYHAYTRWGAFVPYGNEYAYTFYFGQVGIHLFLLISGFVILMSLENSKDVFSFMYKRWLRLFPAMLVATILIFCTAHFFYERPKGIPALSAIVPGLLFIEPEWLKTVSGIPFNALEGSFWSLFVEVKFYVAFGILYFALGRTKAIAGICVLFFLSLLPLVINYPVLEKLLETLSLRQFAWFAGGAFAYLFFVHKQKRYLLLCFAVCSCELWRTFYADPYVIIASYCAITLFLLPVYFENFRAVLSSKFLLFFGFISYPLYLIHENAMIAMIIKFDRVFGGKIPHVILPLIAISVLSVIAYVIAKYLEPLVKNVLLRTVSLVKSEDSAELSAGQAQGEQ
jgi:peptidoglycan/LPS O-acetylase OafA/YrhL